MSAIYNVIGTDIIINAIVYASDVDEVQKLVINELNRRGISASGAISISTDTPGSLVTIQNINSNLRKAGYTGSTYCNPVATASEINDYVAYAKALYLKILRP